MLSKKLPINENKICPGGTTISLSNLKRMKERMLEAGSDIDSLADFFASVGNSHRLRILLFLTEAEELCVCDFAELLNLSMTTVSAHLNKMKLQGILKTRRDAQMIYYSIADKERVSLLASAFSGLRQSMCLAEARI